MKNYFSDQPLAELCPPLAPIETGLLYWPEAQQYLCGFLSMGGGGWQCVETDVHLYVSCISCRRRSMRERSRELRLQLLASASVFCGTSFALRPCRQWLTVCACVCGEVVQDNFSRWCADSVGCPPWITDSTVVFLVYVDMSFLCKWQEKVKDQDLYRK